MIWLVVGLILLMLNGWFAVRDVKQGNITKTTALSWFVVGWLTLDVLQQILELLS